jgi:hypothetical protein
VNSVYLVAPSRHHILHLTVWAHDRKRSKDPSVSWTTGRSVPLCAQEFGRDTWQITGPWAEKWPTHSRYRVCGRCREVVEQLAVELTQAEGGAS